MYGAVLCRLRIGLISAIIKSLGADLMEKMRILVVEEADSTNSLLADLARKDEAQDGYVVSARRQSAGRGQRGNSWESEPGKNLTFSMLFAGRNIDVSRQFFISEAVALGVADVLAEELADSGAEVSVKWPNDIYIGDRKVCGILIENSLTGRRVDRSIAGIGVNINQEVFRSDAPNPVSLKQIDGIERDTDDILERIASTVLTNMDCGDELHSRYMESLWRRDGFHRYVDNLREEEIEARIKDVRATGHLVLELRNGEEREFAFKEVTTLL